MPAGGARELGVGWFPRPRPGPGRRVCSGRERGLGVLVPRPEFGLAGRCVGISRARGGGQCPRPGPRRRARAVAARPAGEGRPGGGLRARGAGRARGGSPRGAARGWLPRCATATATATAAAWSSRTWSLGRRPGPGGLEPGQLPGAPGPGGRPCAVPGACVLGVLLGRARLPGGGPGSAGPRSTGWVWGFCWCALMRHCWGWLVLGAGGGGRVWRVGVTGGRGRRWCCARGVFRLRWRRGCWGRTGGVCPGGRGRGGGRGVLSGWMWWMRRWCGCGRLRGCRGGGLRR